LESVYRQTGIKPPELEELESIALPDVFSFVYEIYNDLNFSRTGNGFSFNPISYSEIYSYCKLLQLTLSVEEVKVIKLLDCWELSYVNSKVAKNQNNKQ